MDFYTGDTQLMWFGTEQKMGWIRTPATGADVGTTRTTADDTLLNGGGYVRNSWGGHKRFQFSWGNAASVELAAKIQAYSRGTFGRGRIFFHDPLYYRTNILPAHVADPSMALAYESPALIAGIAPRSTPTANSLNNLPVLTTIYDLPAGAKTAAADEILIPVPDGMTLRLGSFYTSTGTARVYATSQSGTVPLTKLGLNDLDIAPQSFTDPWVRIGIENPSASPQTISIVANTGRLHPTTGLLPTTAGPWLGGEGHTGTRFLGSPTLVNYTGVNGGQVGLAATLVETGAWEL